MLYLFTNNYRRSDYVLFEIRFKFLRFSEMLIKGTKRAIMNLKAIYVYRYYCKRCRDLLVMTNGCPISLSK